MARIQVLLIEDVINLGLAGEVYAVAGGFARNYLLPRGLAVPATKGALKQAEEIRQAGVRRRAQMRADAESQAEVIGQQKLLFQVLAGENGRLYGSVTSSDIAERLEEATGIEIDRRRILLDQALRDLGVFDVTVRLMPEVDAVFAVALAREEEDWAAAEARQAAIEAAEAAKAEAEAAEAAEAAKAAKAEEEAAETEAETAKAEEEETADEVPG